jgi:predicted RNA methylase
VTAEPIANFTAYFVEKIPDAIVVDACCCVGGNLIQFALRENVKKVIGVELDPHRISHAEHNCCVVYEVPKSKVEFINKSIADADIKS